MYEKYIYICGKLELFKIRNLLKRKYYGYKVL